MSQNTQHSKRLELAFARLRLAQDFVAGRRFTSARYEQVVQLRELSQSALAELTLDDLKDSGVQSKLIGLDKMVLDLQLSGLASCSPYFGKLSMDAHRFKDGAKRHHTLLYLMAPSIELPEDFNKSLASEAYRALRELAAARGLELIKINFYVQGAKELHHLRANYSKSYERWTVNMPIEHSDFDRARELRSLAAAIETLLAEALHESP